MIQRETIEGREATVAYITKAMEPVEPEDADLKKVIFDDGDVWFVGLDDLDEVEEEEEVTDTEGLRERASPEGASAAEALAASRARSETAKKTAKRRAAIRAKLGVTKSPEEREEIARERTAAVPDLVPVGRGDDEWRERWPDIKVSIEKFARTKKAKVGDAGGWKEGDPRGQPENAGQFGPGGFGGAEEDKSAGDPAAAALAAQRKARQLHPEVVEVGGDEWNRQTAIRLEHEYQDAKPELDELLDDYEDGESMPEGHVEPEEDEDAPTSPDEWDYLSADAQEQIKEEYFSSSLEEYVQSEVNQWEESGGKLDEAKTKVASTTDFQYAAVKEWMTEMDDSGEEAVPWTETKFPFDHLDIADAIHLDYNSDGEGTGKLRIVWDDKQLEEVGRELKEDPKQLTLEGIKSPDYSRLLTPAMRIELSTMLKAKFEKAAEDAMDDVEPPDFSDQAKEFMEENWDNGLTDKQKYSWAYNNTSIIEDLKKEYDAAQATGGAHGVIGMPSKFDPLNETSGSDYRKTQKLARAMSIDRAAQVMEKRGIKNGNGQRIGPKTIARIDHLLWDAWKGSSTSIEGQLLQVAIADELGGRLNPKTGHGGKVELDPKKIAEDADYTYKASIGGYAGVKAYVRAKWETTQYLLDKAGKHELELYRGIALDYDEFEEAQTYAKDVASATEVAAKGEPKTYKHAAHINVVRNGAASTTVNPAIANGWSNDETRVVLRTVMPRTAAVSVPAYGINVKSEQEVVVAGTAWKGWTAWIKKAPTFDEVKRMK